MEPKSQLIFASLKHFTGLSNTWVNMHMTRTLSSELIILLLTFLHWSSAQDDTGDSSLWEPRTIQSPDNLDLLLAENPKQLDQNFPSLEERDLTFGWYSHVYNQDHLRQWTFGDTTSTFNISVSTCVGSNDIAGIYQDGNGTTQFDATMGDIVSDLTNISNHKNHRSRALDNILVADRELQTTMETSILCTATDSSRLWTRLLSDGPPHHDATVLINRAAITTFTMSTTPNTTTAISPARNGGAPAIKLGIAAYAAVALTIINNILKFYNEDNVLTIIEEAFMASMFVARARWLVWRAGTEGAFEGPCVTADQAVVAVVEVAGFEDEGLGIRRADDDGMASGGGGECP